MTEVLRGLVIRAQSRRYSVQVEDRILQTSIPKRMRFENPEVVDPVAVGDVVQVLVQGESAIIQAVEPRRNVLTRVALGKETRQLLAANVDLAVIVLSARDPQWKASTLDRYLVMASVARIPALVCLNKTDLDPRVHEDPGLEPYRALGIAVLVVSALEGTGLRSLEEAIAGKTVVLFGPSGAGKSSLMNRLIPQAQARVGTISASTGKGTHTTSWVEMNELPRGGHVIDSPGLRALDLTGVDVHDLVLHFPEMAARRDDCRFPDCLHRAEPNCGIKAKVESGTIHPARYDSYLRILASLERGQG